MPRWRGNPTVFGHGMLTAGFVAKCITDAVGAGNLRRYKVRFATRVWPGDTITCSGRVTRRYEEAGESRIDGEVTATTQTRRDGGDRHVHGRGSGGRIATPWRAWRWSRAAGAASRRAIALTLARDGWAVGILDLDGASAAAVAAEVVTAGGPGRSGWRRT